MITMDFDISEMFEEENCKYERDHRGQIKISVIPEIELSPEEKARSDAELEELGRKNRESLVKIEQDMKSGTSPFGRVNLSEGLQELMEK